MRYEGFRWLGVLFVLTGIFANVWELCVAGAAMYVMFVLLNLIPARWRATQEDR